MEMQDGSSGSGQSSVRESLDCSGEDSEESTSDAEDGERCAAGARAGVKAPRKRSLHRQATKLRQARRNKTITRLVMDQEHTYGFALWQDCLGVDHACGPLAYRDEVVRGLVDILSKMRMHADAQGEDPDADVFRCPEDAVSGRLGKEDLVKIMRFLEWFKVAQKWKDRAVPDHMSKYSNGEWFAPVVKVPAARKGVWDQQGEALQLWKDNARALLDMTAWSKDTSGAVQDSHRMSIRDIFSVRGRDLKSTSTIKLVACLGIWLNWHHPGGFVNFVVLNPNTRL